MKGERVITLKFGTGITSVTMIFFLNNKQYGLPKSHSGHRCEIFEPNTSGATLTGISKVARRRKN